MTLQKSIVAAVLFLALVACNTSSADTKPQAPQPAKSALSKEAQQALNDVFASYEKLRALLAADKTEGVSKEAETLKLASQEAMKKAPSLKVPLDALVSTTEQLKVSEGKIEESRKEFGEVSKNIVALAVVEPSLQSGRFIFECPMAAGYQKWVQTNAEISNPHMGAKMLGCGTTSTWK
jgi:hypothetical protein